MPKRRTFSKFQWDNERLLLEPIPNHEIDDFQVQEYTRVYGFLRILTLILRFGTVPIYFQGTTYA
jgi:hypothetical protein